MSSVKYFLPYIQNGAIAISTSRTKQIVVVLLAVGLSIALEKVARAQLLAAVAASKVLRVPGLAQGRDHLTNDRLLAGVAAALLRCCDPTTAHISVQVAEHRIQLVALGQGARRRLDDGRVLNSLVRLGVVRHRLHLVAAHCSSAVVLVVVVVVASVAAAAVHLYRREGGWLGSPQVRTSVCSTVLVVVVDQSK